MASTGQHMPYESLSGRSILTSLDRAGDAIGMTSNNPQATLLEIAKANGLNTAGVRSRLFGRVRARFPNRSACARRGHHQRSPARPVNSYLIEINDPSTRPAGRTCYEPVDLPSPDTR